MDIYEFSRELLDTSFKNGRWVSGGFGAEVGKSNQDVPQSIQDAVNRGDFRIYDSYPPKQEDYALIAREINEYSVLAVATRVGDDKTRFLIAYRYFWLQKPTHQDIDGVGTLLIWWMNSGEPTFDFEWTPNSRTLNYTAQYFLRENSYQHFRQYRSHVEDILPQIKQYPFAYQFNEVNSRNALHYLALYLNREYNTPISWAWNVGWLESPKNFTLICSDEKSHKSNSRDIKNYQKLQKLVVPPFHTSPSPVPTHSENYSVGGNTVREESVPPNRQEPANARNVVKTSNTQNKSDFNQIRTSLKNIADNQNIEIEMQKLCIFLEKYPRINFKEHDIIDNFNKDYSSPFKIRYTALLAILGYVSVSEWLENLNALNNNKDKNAFLNTQKELLEYSKKNNPNSVYVMFKNNINNDISELLLKFKQTNDRETHRDIEWLLLKSNSIWVKCFNEYAKELVVKLIIGVEQGNDQFYDELQQNNSQGYKNLAFLFQKLPNESLSAYFYQLSEDSVPSHIYDKADTAVIPMTRKSTNKGRNQYLNLISQKIRRNPALIVTLTLGCFTIGALVHSFNNKNTVLKHQNPNKIGSGQLESEKKLQSSIELYKKNNDVNAKKEIKTYLDKLQSPSIDMRSQEDYKWIKQEFIPKENFEYPKQQENYVRKAQTILKLIGYTEVTIDGQLGAMTKTKYQTFQKENQKKEKIDIKELPPEGRNVFVQGASTWKALTNKLTDKQVEETAKFLLKEIDKLPDNNKFQESMDNLKNECKDKPSLEYIQCVKSLQ